VVALVASLGGLAAVSRILSEAGACECYRIIRDEFEQLRC
jgi:hypothetical protein